MTTLEIYEELEAAIIQTYTGALLISEAEGLAAKCLHAQLLVINDIRVIDLDARMKKAGLKTIRAAAYMEAARSGEKKPTEAMIGAMVDLDPTVSSTQAQLDSAEVERNQLQQYLDVFSNAHIYYRGVAKDNG